MYFVICDYPNHWITMVINKGRTQAIYYYRFNGYNRVHSEEIRQLIAVLEGLDEPEAPPIESCGISSNDPGPS